MDLPEGTATFEGRLATFEQTQLPKRRASSVKKSQKTTHTASWPHTTPTPDELARAGFYYKPTEEHEDSVTCFLCGKTLDGWEPNDVPALEHFAKVPECGWAINICIEQRGGDGDTARTEEDPLSTGMMEARKATFQNYWPHEKKKGWKCKTKKMVEAGWCYNPVPGGDDCVKCFYCGLTLDGWEPKDDPLEEHRRREPDCPFFALVDEHKKSKRTKGKSKGRTARSSQASSRASTQSNITTVSEAPSFAFLDDFTLPEEDADEGDTVMTSASTKSRTAGSRGGRGKGAGAKGIKRGKRGQKTTTEDSSTVLEESNMVDDRGAAVSEVETVEETQTQGKGRRGKRNTSQSVQSLEEAVEVSQIVPKPKSIRTRGRKMARDDSEGVSREQMNDISSMERPNNHEREAKRGKKRTSDGQVKDESSLVQEEPEKMIEHVEEPISQVEEPRVRGKASKSKAKTTRKPSAQKKAPKAKDENDIPEPDDADIVETVAEGSKKPTSKRTKKKAIAEEAPEARQELNEEALERSNVVESEEKTGQADVEAMETSKAIETKARKAGTLTPTKKTVSQVMSPAQSSDAENQPPSSRPSKQSAQGTEVEEERLGSTQKTSLTVSTPAASPLRRNNTTAGGLVSEQAWTAVDLDTVFLASPTSKGAGQDVRSVEEVLQQFKSAEKQMSVEEWIMWRAQNAEGKLKDECERMIGKFESEGVRALRAIEGISCV